jgi:ferredoxin
MVDIKINGLKVSVDEGATVLEAANAGVASIPTLCHMKGIEPETSCMLCVVKDLGRNELIPACSTPVIDGMDIDTECDEVLEARRDILNLLLSEHVGDCEAPCTRICPAHLDIPLMLREIERGNMQSAAWIALRDLALPATLGYVCPAPCEKGCRRAQLDHTLSIRELHRQTVEEILRESGYTKVLGQAPKVPLKAVAVIGSGPAGLSCAWKLCQLGYACKVFDEAPQAGGCLRDHPELPLDILDAEVAVLEKAGIEFSLGQAVSMHEIFDDFDGVVFAAAEFSGTHFADAVYAEEHRLTVKAVANGKASALALDRLLQGEAADAPKRFDSRIGPLRPSELEELVKNCAAEEPGGKTARQTEAGRCLHCDCRNTESCKLRIYATRYGASQHEFPADERAHVQLIGHNESVVFEPGKCIKCGLCIKLTKRAGEGLGLTFVGRGFNTRVAVPFGETLENGLKKAAAECVEACPTSALAFADTEEHLDGIAR